MKQDLLRENEELLARLEEAEETIAAIQTGGVDALIVSGPEGDRVFALEGADYHYRVLVEVMNEGVLTLGLDGTILSCNNRFSDFVKTPVEHLLGKPLEKLVTDADMAKLRRFLEEAEKEGRTLAVNLACADGEPKPANLSGRTFEVAGLHALCLVVTDLTETAAAAKAQAWLASIVDSSNDAIISTSFDNTILTWNAAAERIYGYSAQEAVGQHICIFMPRDRHHEIPMINEKVCKGRRVEHYETVHTTQSGTPIHVSQTVSPLFDAHGKVTAMSIIARDITEQVQAREEARLQQQQLVHADKMVSLGILTSGVAHEINNPNHSIMSNTALFAEAWAAVRPLLEREFRESGDFVLAGFDYSRARDEFPKMLEAITTSSRRIEAIVAELRDFAQHSPKEAQTTIEVQPVIESACQLLTSMIKKSTDNFSVSLDGNLPKIVANRQRIEQVLINLIQNACQSLSGREKSITVIAAPSPDSEAVVIVVNDEGTGITPENLKHLGDPFFTTKRGVGGTGLGLWVSFSIVREHGGILEFFSNPGQGTRVELTLPAIHEHDLEPSVTPV